MIKNSPRRTMMMLSFLCFIMCSGCIASGNNGETAPPTSTVAPTTTPPTTTLAPTTVPPNVDTTPILASELQAEWEELQSEQEWRGAEVQEMLDEIQAMLGDPDPDYEAMGSAFGAYEESWRDYLRALIGCYHASILLEHTTPIEGDLLALKKETLPFVRPDGEVYTFGEVNMAGESVMIKFNKIRSYIQEGISGQDVREALIHELQRLEDYLPLYHDMEIGHEYYHLSYVLFKQSLYSDILIRDCNPHCI